MNKANKYSGFIALVVLIGLVMSGCASLGGTDSASAGDGAGGRSSSARGGGSSAIAQAGGGSSSAQAVSDSSSAKTVGIHRLIAAVQKTWSKFVGFLGKNWLSLLIILIICIVCATICRTIKRKIKKPLIKRNIIMAAVILVSFGLIFGVLHFGIMRHDGNLQHLKLEQSLKRVDLKHVSFKNNGAKTKHAYVNVNKLNFRSGPSLSSRVIRGLSRNTRVEVLNDSGTWWKVKYENTEGYLNSTYLRKKLF